MSLPEFEQEAALLVPPPWQDSNQRLKLKIIFGFNAEI